MESVAQNPLSQIQNEYRKESAELNHYETQLTHDETLAKHYKHEMTETQFTGTHSLGEYAKFEERYQKAEAGVQAASKEIISLSKQLDQNVGAAESPLSQIQSNYYRELADLGALAAEEAQLSIDEQAADKALNNEHYTTSHWSFGDMGESTDNHHTRWSEVNIYNSMEGHIGSIGGKINSLDNALEALDPSATLSDLLSGMNNVTQGTSATTDLDGRNVSITEYLNHDDLHKSIETLVEMIRLQLQIDQDSDNVENGGKGSESLEMQIIRDESEQSGDFTALSNALDASMSVYVAKEGSGEVGKYGSNAAVQFVGSFGWNDSNSKLRVAERQMRHAVRDLNAITAALGGLSQVGADMANTVFTSSFLAIDNVMQEAQSILSDPKLSAREKEAKLAVCLQLVLGFVQIILQQAENLRSKNQAEMAKADVKAQKLNLEKIAYLSQVFEEVEKQQHEMNICQKVLMGVEIAASIALAASGSIGVAIAMLTMTTLQASGESEKLTNGIAADLQRDGAKNSKLDADAIVMGISILGTMGAGAIIDQIVAKTAAAIADLETQAVLRASQEMIKEAADKAASDAIKEAGAAVSNAAKVQAQQAAYKTIEDSVEKSVQAAARNAARAFSKRSVADLITLRVRKSVAVELSRSIQKSAEEAAQTAVKGSEEAAKVAAKEAISNASGAATQIATESTIRGIVRSAAGKALATVLNGAQSIGKNENFRSALWAGVYTAASTNMLVDIATAINSVSKDKTGKKKFEEIIETCMEVVQMLIQMVAMLKGGGFLNVAASENPTPVIKAMQRASSIAEIGSQAGDAGLNYQAYVVQKKEARAVTELDETEANISFQKSYTQEQSKEASKTNPAIATEQKRLAQAQSWLAGHMWDGMEAGCKVLAARSI